jgi:WD40 repeat protein
VLDATTPKTVITLKGDEGHEDWVFDAAYSPDGKHIVTGSSDRTAKIWDASNGRLVRTLRGHEHQVRRVAYSSDGNFIVTASWDATVKIWRAQDGQIVRTLRGHGNRVMGATFKNDGSTIVTAGDDGTMHQHPVSIDDLLALAESRVTRSLSDEERSTYLVEP